LRTPREKAVKICNRPSFVPSDGEEPQPKWTDKTGQRKRYEITHLKSEKINKGVRGAAPLGGGFGWFLKKVFVGGIAALKETRKGKEGGCLLGAESSEKTQRGPT